MSQLWHLGKWNLKIGAWGLIPSLSLLIHASQLIRLIWCESQIHAEHTGLGTQARSIKFGWGGCRSEAHSIQGRQSIHNQPWLYKWKKKILRTREEVNQRAGAEKARGVRVLKLGQSLREWVCSYIKCGWRASSPCKNEMRQHMGKDQPYYELLDRCLLF